MCAVVACGVLGGTNIRDVADNPRLFDGQTVIVRGEVIQSFNMLLVRGYVLRDATGEIGILSARPVPKTGERVVVAGRVDQLFAWGDASLVVIRELPR